MNGSQKEIEIIRKAKSLFDLEQQQLMRTVERERQRRMNMQEDDLAKCPPLRELHGLLLNAFGPKGLGLLRDHPNPIGIWDRESDSKNSIIDISIRLKPLKRRTITWQWINEVVATVFLCVPRANWYRPTLAESANSESFQDELRQQHERQLTEGRTEIDPSFLETIIQNSRLTLAEARLVTPRGSNIKKLLGYHKKLFRKDKIPLPEIRLTISKEELDYY
ncbi:MAG: hypothetical protein ACFFGZ_08485 [Candidatus Thorarchaeota archaeon]